MTETIRQISGSERMAFALGRYIDALHGGTGWPDVAAYIERVPEGDSAELAAQIETVIDLMPEELRRANSEADAARQSAAETARQRWAIAQIVRADAPAESSER